MSVWNTVYNIGWEVGREAGRRAARGIEGAESDEVGPAKREAKELIDLLQKRFGPIAIDIRECIPSADFKSIQMWNDSSIASNSSGFSGSIMLADRIGGCRFRGAIADTAPEP